MHLMIDASRANDVTCKTGVHYSARYMIEALMNVIPSHVRVTLITGKKLDKDWPSLPAHWKHTQLRWPFPLWTTIRLSAHMLRHLKPDTYLYVPASQPPLIHPSLIATIHDIGFVRVPKCYPWHERIWQRIITRYTLARARLIIVPSAFTKKEIVEYYHAEENAIEVVPNAAAADIRDAAIAHDKHADTELINQSPALLYIGRIERKKNVSCIVQAFEIIKRSERYKNMTLTLVGADGYGSQEIHDAIKRSTYAKDIICTNYVSKERKHDLLSAARVLLLPSWYEGFGIPILEARALKVSVIASDIPPHHEVGGEEIAYADPSRPEEWAKVIHNVLSSKHTQTNEKNHKEYSWNASAQLWWKKVSHLANKKNETYNDGDVA